MFWLNFKRIVRAGFIQFWRNGIVSLSAVLVMIVTLFVIGGLLFGTALLKSSLNEIKDKVDVNVYFLTSANEEQVLEVKKSLESLPEVSFVEYISRDQALSDFFDRHANDQKTLEALEELDENPLGAVLNIKAKETSQYESVARFLEANYPSDSNSIVERVNYFQNKEAIEKLSQIIEAGRKLGFIITIIFIIISIIITLNTIRLAMFISKEEINVMKLVGAGQFYISGPFIVTGAIYGLFSSIITLILFWPLAYWLGPTTERFFGSMSIFEYYISDFGRIFLIIVGSGILIGAISSSLALNRYLKHKKRK